MTSTYEQLGERLRGLMRLALAGDKAAYASLLGGVAPLVRAYARSRGAGADEAEDLAQEVLLTVHKKKHLYDPARPFIPWLYALTRYRAIDRARARAARPSVPWEDGFDPPAADPAPDRALEVEELLSSLPSRARRVLTLAKLEGRPLAEVARLMDMTETAVKVAVHRAVKKLQETFAP